MSEPSIYGKLATKYSVPTEAVEALASILEKTGGISARFDIESLGGKGMWKLNQRASVGNGFNEELNTLVTNLCNDLSEAIRAFDEATEIRPRRTGGLDDTIGLMPISLMPNLWWPESYGIAPDVIGNAGTLRYAYFADKNRLVIRQNLRNRIFDTAGHTVIKLLPGEKAGFFHLLVKTEADNIPIAKLKEVQE